MALVIFKGVDPFMGVGEVTALAAGLKAATGASAIVGSLKGKFRRFINA
ncbi:hypothetical protein ACFV30_40340 [Streptomyces sp. NPDC059752]